ncbi:SH3 domain-containing protein [Clostridium sp. WILCCON 0269]|uniref:SH3 domain-containing protein n=1 Tax=Candidatus Clostridium eludens TaxID=3381663 RepID=A0ABW8SDC4_9CLOT
MRKKFVIINILILSFILLVPNMVTAPTNVRNVGGSNKIAHSDLIPAFYCVNNSINIRSEPNTSSAVLGSLYYGDVVDIDDTDYYYNSFIKIHHNGIIGYVHAAYLDSVE